ncbi:hypothetical protein BurJ1DRAFT_4483 [Burkholderiales bacterium JOSHI_001]|nr:hypothetical protein BurJ1DRAFT_4483 [Burkholderiales bacterium JOSHI_001]
MNTARTASAAPAFNAPRRAASAASLVLAAVMTLGVLAGLHTLAVSENAAVQQELAQSAASGPRS